MSAQDVRAAAEVHRELGPEYNDAVVDSFLEKVEARLDERLNARLADLSLPRRRPLARLSHKGRHNLLAGVAIGVGAVGVWLGLTEFYANIYHADSYIWAALLIASAVSCGAGLARLFGRKCDETAGSQSRKH
jgi:hypothetical protein